MVCDCFLVLSSLQRWFSEYSMSSARVAIDLRWYFFKTFMVQYNDSTGNEVFILSFHRYVHHCIPRQMRPIFLQGQIYLYSPQSSSFSSQAIFSSQSIIILDANVMAGKRVRSSSNFFASYIVLTILFGSTCHPYILEYTSIIHSSFSTLLSTILPPLATSLSTG